MSLPTRSAASRRSLAVAVSTIALLAGAPAFAQDNAATADNTDSNEIIVTAQFRQQNLQDTPLAITAVNAETMEAKSQTNLAQVADSAPNVTLKPQGASFGPSISVSIRGIGAGDFNPAYEPGVGIYIDDVYMGRSVGGAMEFRDIASVQVLRGPQGTLFGRNTIGGAVLITSNQPGEGAGQAGGQGPRRVRDRPRRRPPAGDVRAADAQGWRARGVSP